MGKFMQKERHRNDPKWLGGLKQHVEKAREADVTDTIRNYGGIEGSYRRRGLRNEAGARLNGTPP